MQVPELPGNIDASVEMLQFIKQHAELLDVAHAVQFAVIKNRLEALLVRFEKTVEEWPKKPESE